MADESKLIGWVLRNNQELGLSIDDMTWIKDFFPTLTDVEAKIRFEGKDYFGWGWGNYQEEALAKAIAECLERIVLRQYGFETSNGIAAHMTAAKAENAAKNELRERDLLLGHFYIGRPFKKIAHGPITASAASFTNWLRQRDISLNFYHLGETGVVCAIDGRNAGLGFSVGGAIKDTLESSILSSCIEAGRRVHRFVVGRDDVSPHNLNEFSKISRPSFSDHGRLAMDRQYADQIAHLFNRTGELLNQPLKGIETESLSITLKNGVLDCPLHFARATSISAQHLFTGMPTHERLNLKRLSELAGRELDWKDVIDLPHPID